MNAKTDSYENADIRIGEVIWPRAEGIRNLDQQRDLINLVDMAGTGLILDCALVEIGNSEIISLLMRVRNHAKKAEKEIALFNVPDTLTELLQVCNLRAVLPAAEDLSSAKRLVYDLSQGKGHRQLWVESNLMLVGGAAACACLIFGLAFWLFFLR